MLPPLSKTATFGNPDSSYKNPPDVLNVYVAGRRIDENYQIAPTFFIYQSFISPLDAFQVASAIIGPKKHIAVFFDFSERTADGQIFTRHFISQDGGPFQEIREDRLLGSVVPYLGDYDEAINTPPATPIVVTVFNSEGITKKIRAPFLESKLWGNRILSQHSFSDPTEAFTFAKSQTQPERLVMIGFLFDEKSERGVPFQRTFLSWDDEPFQEVINSSFRDQAVPYLGKFTSYLPPLSKTAEYEKEETSQPITEVWVSENKEVSPYLQDRLDLKRSFPDPLLAFRYAKTLTQPNFLIYVVPMFYERVFNEKYRCDEVIRRLFISRNDQDFEETQGIRHDEDLPILPYQGDLVQLAKTAHHLPPLSKSSGTFKDMEGVLRYQRFTDLLREYGATDEQIRGWEHDEDWDDDLLQEALNEEHAFYAGDPLQRNIKNLRDDQLVFFSSFPSSVVPPLTAAERNQIYTELQNRDIIVEDFDPTKTYQPWQHVLDDSFPYVLDDSFPFDPDNSVVWYRSADFFEPRKEEEMKFPQPLQHLPGYVPHPDEPTEAQSLIPLLKTAALPTPNIPNEWFELSSQHHPLLPPPTEEIRVYIRHDLERDAETHTFESLDAAYQFAESLDPNTKLIRIERILGREPKYSDLTDEIEAQLIREYQKTNQPIPLGATLGIEYKKWVDKDWTATADLATFYFTVSAGVDHVYTHIMSYIHLPNQPPVRTSSSLPLFIKKADEESIQSQTPTRVRVCQIDPETEMLRHDIFEWFEDPHQAFAWARSKTQPGYEVKVEFWFDEETEDEKRFFRTFTSRHDEPFIEEIHPEGDSSTYVSPYLGKFTNFLPPLTKAANEEHEATTKVLVSQYKEGQTLPLIARRDLEKIFPDPYLAFDYAKTLVQPEYRIVVFPEFYEQTEDGQSFYRYWASDHGEDFIENLESKSYANIPTIPYLGDFSQIAKVSTSSVPVFKIATVDSIETAVAIYKANQWDNWMPVHPSSLEITFHGHPQNQWFGDPYQAFSFAKTKIGPGYKVVVDPGFYERDEEGAIFLRKFTSEHGEDFVEERFYNIGTPHPSIIRPYLGKLATKESPDPNYVQILIETPQHEVLQHHYLKAKKWDLPAGRIENNESPKQAATRELLERTGYQIDPNDLEYLGKRDGFFLFTASSTLVKQVRKPQTEIRWFKVEQKPTAASLLPPLTKTASKTWHVEWEWKEISDKWEPPYHWYVGNNTVKPHPDDLIHPNNPNLKVPATQRPGDWIIVNHPKSPGVSSMNPWRYDDDPELLARFIRGGLGICIDQGLIEEGDQILVNNPTNQSFHFVVQGDDVVKLGNVSCLPPLTKKAASLPTLNIPQEWYEASSYTHPALPPPTEKIAVLYKTPDLTTNVDYLDFESLQQAHNYAESLDPETPWIIISHTLGLYFPEVYSKSPTISKDIPSSPTQVPLSAELKIQYVKGKEDEDWKAQAIFNRFTLEYDANYRLMVQYNYPDINAEPTRYVVGIL